VPCLSKVTREFLMSRMHTDNICLLVKNALIMHNTSTGSVLTQTSEISNFGYVFHVKVVNYINSFLVTM